MLDPEGHKLKTARNREWSARYLREQGILFSSHNEGAHLIIRTFKPADFWPGTGLWIVRGTGRKGRGVKNLVRELRRP